MMIKFIPVLLVFFLVFSCKSADKGRVINDGVNTKISLEKKKDGSYEITMEPEIFFFDNAGYIFYYQFLYKYPDDIFYLRLFPENSKDKFYPDTFSINYENNVVNLQVVEIKRQDPKVKSVQKIIICDYPSFNILKDDAYAITLKMKCVYNGEDKEMVSNLENYDKVYFREISGYIDSFKIKLQNSAEKKLKK
jgi:hypothetical protein